MVGQPCDKCGDHKFFGRRRVCDDCKRKHNTEYQRKYRQDPKNLEKKRAWDRAYQKKKYAE